MRYENIISGTFLERPNRFTALVIPKDGDEKGMTVSAHVKNTGRCAELLVPGTTAYLEDFCRRMGRRKLRYSLISVEKQREDLSPLMINMDSQAPNKVVEEGLEDGRIVLPEMEKLTAVQREVTHGDSRFDFYLEGCAGQKGFAEVKGVTLEEKGVARFPDAPTERGVKHVNGLIKAVEEGYCAYMIFVLQMEGMKCLRPNDDTQPAFGEALRKADAAGVHIMAYQCRVGRDTLDIADSVPVILHGR